MAHPSTRPERDEYADYYLTYVSKVPDGDILATLDAQARAVVALFEAVSEEQARHRYAPGKWTLKEVLSHINDTERVFAGRALWFARGFDAPLPGFDQDVAVANAGANDRPWSSHVAEFAAVRASSLVLFQSLSGDAWIRRGTASDNPFTVRALAWIVAGHVAHHLDIIRERYLGPG